MASSGSLHEREQDPKCGRRQENFLHLVPAVLDLFVQKIVIEAQTNNC